MSAASRAVLVLFTAIILSSQTPTKATLDREEDAMLTLINKYRAQNGAGALHVSMLLQNSSKWMSTDMAAKNYFSHTDSLGRDPFKRMSAFHYTYAPAAENLAAGFADAQNTFKEWVTACDPDAKGACTYAHRKNMSNPSYTVIGIARAYNAAATYRWSWATDLGGSGGGKERSARLQAKARRKLKRLAGILDRPVIDRTGIAGKFDIHLQSGIDKFTPRYLPGGDLARFADPAASAALPSILTAIQELGLKLEPANGPREFLLIDHVEKPVEN